MGTEDILVTEFRRHTIPNYQKLHKKCLLSLTGLIKLFKEQNHIWQLPLNIGFWNPSIVGNNFVEHLFWVNCQKLFILYMCISVKERPLTIALCHFSGLLTSY